MFLLPTANRQLQIANCKRNISRFAVVILGLIILMPSLAYSGNLDSPANATDPASAMFTIEDIFNRLGSSTTVTKRSGGFTEPLATPASTGHTLDDVMDLVDSRSRAMKTGQTTLFATGDDGDVEKGITWPNPRFTDNGDGTVTDNLTTLIWLKDANCAGGTRNWATALNDVDSLNGDGTMNSIGCGDTGNNNDWRLPNINELRSLIDFSNSSPALPTGHPFGATVQNNSYWSSTTFVSDTVSAWIVGLDVGNVNNGLSKTNSRFVWPVRGGQ